MTEKEQFIYSVMFENEFLKKNGNEFQAFFSKIMNAVFPSRFLPICPWGNLGDQKCDGYLIDDNTVFQVYAPRELGKNKTVSKMKADFNGAREKWGDQIKKWVFVDNAHDGIPPFVVETLNEFRKQYPGIDFNRMGFVELKSLLFSESDSEVVQVLGAIPSDIVISGKPRIITSDYWEVIRNINDMMLLNRYDWWNEHAMRGLLFDRLVENKLPLWDLKMSFVWPEIDLDLERILKDVIDGFAVFVEKFMEHAFLRSDSFWAEERFYKKQWPNPNYHRDLELFKKWEDTWFMALNNYVFLLNSLIEYLNKKYTVDIRALKRKKLLIDSMGIYGGSFLSEQHFYPNKLFLVE